MHLYIDSLIFHSELKDTSIYIIPSEAFNGNPDLYSLWVLITTVLCSVKSKIKV